MAALNFPTAPALNDTYQNYVWNGTQWVSKSVAQGIGIDTHAATSKTLPVDTDEIPLIDSAASWVLKKLTWANLKSTLKTYLDTLYPSGSGSSTGTNTGDNSVNTLYSGLVTNATHTGDATGSGALTVVALNGTNLAGLATGILKNTTATGIPSIAIAADFPTLNQNTTGTASVAVTAANASALQTKVTGTSGNTIPLLDGNNTHTGTQLFSAAVDINALYSEKLNARGSISGAQTIDNTLGTYVTATITSATTFTFSNPVATGKAGGFMLELTNGGAGAITWPTSVKWPGGTAPTLTAAGVDLLLFTTRDGGTIWRAVIGQKDSK